MRLAIQTRQLKIETNDMYLFLKNEEFEKMPQLSKQCARKDGLENRDTGTGCIIHTLPSI
jgi:hypothetical protein